MKIPVSKPSISDLERQYVADVMDSGWISSLGPYVKKFEEAWAKWNGVKHGVACSSGSTALVLALRALGVGPGDEVIVPEFTMIATAWAVTACGATPVFVDCLDNLNINPDLIEEVITSKTKVIMPVHIYGRQCDMDKILKIAHDYNIYVVEDSAEAHGVKPRGDIACFSFFANKIISTGEGGMCLTNDTRLAEQMKHLSSMAFDGHHTFHHKKVAYNYRMTNLQAAIGLAQVERLDQILDIRKYKILNVYDHVLPDSIKMPFRDVLWMYDINLGDRRDEIKKILEDAGIETRYFFKPMSMQPMYKAPYEHLNAYKWSKQGIYLPTFTDMTQDNIRDVSIVLNEALK